MILELKDKKISLDLKAKNGGLYVTDIENRLSLMKQLDDFEHFLRLDLLQKAKKKWAIEGDENSNFFHGIVNNKFPRSRTNGIFINCQWVTNLPLVTNHIYNFHK